MLGGALVPLGLAFVTAPALVTWSASLQRIVTLSFTEAELVALTIATQEALWLKRLLKEFGYTGANISPITILEDNNGAIKLAKNPESHKRTKHIEVRWYFYREQQARGNVKVEYVSTNNNKADGFTKSLGKQKHGRFLSQLSMN